MQIETLNTPYVIEKGEVNGQVVQLTIRAVEGAALGYDEVKEATGRLLDYFRRSTHTDKPSDDATSHNAAEAVHELVAAYTEGKGRVSDEYLVRLAAAYEALVPEGRGVSAKLASYLGKPVPTVKGHIMRARKEGYLSEAFDGREGGELTEPARKLLGELAHVSISLRPESRAKLREDIRKLEEE
ncbi:hypothetical protein [Gordonia sp. KTR9]|uniref:hypothetical protein n=1 Tax=Gordonia sp. KTR9 TaxID=337191 RepID=UPI00027DDEBC|nr:hypothetical protein [Gordonia sp. KTR9]AFR50029.1 hypothetical protein KTR9_3394 [Gordonia sp. KTR9]